MYESFFGLKFPPFSVPPDSGAILWTDQHALACSVLELGLDRLSPITVLTGDIGTGKTTLIQHLLRTSCAGFTAGLLSNFLAGKASLKLWAC